MKTVSSILLIITIFFTITACANGDVEKNTMAIGEISQQQLIRDHNSFQQSYQAFELSEREVTAIKRWPSNLHIDVYFGSWCHDSQREVPRFLKVLAENNTLSYRLIGLDYDKSEPNGLAKSHDIHYTPTFIVYQNSKELGRIIERPQVSLTADISAML
ncbi:thioredoxin family protein [Colwellia sp. M166]|uniref:thioredoxin family protein n=1 Tax=Colwellia sp. M166 TaxID=2583805 RepID=UPI00211EBE95|nr:thioredoxin family protein [Colwellia sp. M166]UUO23205.1 thioredoxin family protein [Colwellia sp. M166]|tara:strand:- start:11040 stop:11516 length:477 start_codon:yes stop_codon:yes gene_type:complete